MQRDRDVAGQESERVGVPRRLNARLGHHAHQVGPGAQAPVLAAFGDDETLGKVALVGRGEDFGQVFERRVHIDQQRVGVGVQAAGPAAIDVAKENLQKQILQGLAADQPHRALAFHQGQRMQTLVLLEQARHQLVAG